MKTQHRTVTETSRSAPVKQCVICHNKEKGGFDVRMDIEPFYLGPDVAHICADCGYMIRDAVNG